jgi:arylsulfate sulfotransferase
VRFARQGSPFWSSTPLKPCVPGESVNFYVAGMRPLTQYRVQQENWTGFSVARGPVLTLRTGFPLMTFEPKSVVQAADVSASLVDGVLLSTYAQADHRQPIATNLAGQLIWYYDKLGLPGQSGFVTRPVPGGTMLIIMGDENHEGQVLREIDLAGNAVKETHAISVTRQLQAMGEDPIGAFHHEAIRLPNGHTVVVASVERLLTDVQGAGTVDVLGDMVIDLDQNLQVAWLWNSFEHLDVTRQAILGETCTSEGPGCPPLFLSDTANDWLHTNSVAYDPSDGNLIISMRHQDWVIKVNYADGQGNGDVIWRLGKDGDFAFTSDDPTDPWPWFSHQHDAGIFGDTLMLFDNGNTRIAQAEPDGNSRGMVIQLDETHRTAVSHAFDLAGYSFALGAAEPLSNGDYQFTNGFLQGPLGPFSQSIEVRPDGSFAFVFQSLGAVYRGFRMIDLYRP